MIFLFIIPAFAGLANFVVPLMLGAEDMAFPRLNALSFWMLPTAGVIMVLSLLWGGFNTGWTGYATLSTHDPTDQGTFFNMGVQFAGTSSILTAVNFIVTILTMRAPGMTLSRMPLLVWANLTTSALVVLGTPFIAASQFMVMFDRVMHTKFFDVAEGGSTIMYQHIFWFYSHPAVYIMMLPGFGIISEVISVMARKPIFGYRALAFSTVSIGVLGFSVWAHHMFVAGVQPWLRVPIMITTMLIAIPTGIKVFSWVATLYGGVINLATPMLWALGFLFTFVIGGLSGIWLAVHPDRHPGLRHVLRRRAHPLRAVRRVSLHDLRGPLLLVPEDDREDVQREARQVALLADVHLVQRDVLPAALHRHARHAAARLDVRREVRRLEPLHHVLGLRARSRDADLRLQRDHLVVARRARAGQPVARADDRVAGLLAAADLQLRRRAARRRRPVQLRPARSDGTSSSTRRPRRRHTTERERTR